MSEITGILHSTVIDAKDYHGQDPFAIHDPLRDQYFVYYLEGGDVIGVTQALLEVADHHIFKPIPNKCYQAGKYILEPIGKSSEFQDCILFRVTESSK